MGISYAVDPGVTTVVCVITTNFKHTKHYASAANEASGRIFGLRLTIPCREPEEFGPV